MKLTDQDGKPVAPTWLRGAQIIHLPTGTVGRFDRYYDGVTDLLVWKVGEIEQTLHGRAVTMMEGDSFVVKTGEEFRALTDGEARIYAVVQDAIATCCRESVPAARALGVEVPVLAELLGSALRRQLYALRKM